MKPAMLAALVILAGCSAMQVQHAGHASEPPTGVTSTEQPQADPNLVAAFDDRGALKQRFPEAEPVGRYGEVSIWRIDMTPERWRELAAIGRYSPVFGKEQGQMRALPGGVVLRLAPALSGPKVDAWFRDKRLSARPLPGLPGTYLVDTAPGLASLELARQLAASPDVVKAEPNWWLSYSLRK